VTETSAAESLEGERKTVTALFAYIKGSMELIEDLDPEEARAIVDPALKLMMEAVQHYAATSLSRPGTASSHCSAHRSRTKTTLSVRYTLRCECRSS
jgi:class 3 adenylate cyclase